MATWIAVLQLLCSFAVLPSIALQIYEFPSNCHNVDLAVKVGTPESGRDSSGIVVTSRSNSYAANSSCNITLKGSRGMTILLAIRRYDFRSQCKDNVTIYTSSFNKVTYCGNRNSDSETSTLVGTQEMKIQFQSGPGFTAGFRGFEFVFTGIYQRPATCFASSRLFRCNNGNCISSLLKCDGHNHCGDRSAQRNCGPSGGAIAGYTIGAIFLVVALVAGIVYYTKRRRVITTTTTYPTGGVMHPPPYQPYNPTYR